MSQEFERAVARSKSYIGAAALVFLLYSLGWLPGFIANWLYLQEAKRMENTAGQSLSGVGCLSLMFWLNLIALVVILLITVVAVLLSLGPQLAS
jgi:hypothetical protein